MVDVPDVGGDLLRAAQQCLAEADPLRKVALTQAYAAADGWDEAALEVKFFAAFDEAVFAFTGFFELCNQHRRIDVGIRQRFDLFSQLTIFSPKGFEFCLKVFVVPEFRHWG